MCLCAYISCTLACTCSQLARRDPVQADHALPGGQLLWFIERRLRKDRGSERERDTYVSLCPPVAESGINPIAARL